MPYAAVLSRANLGLRAPPVRVEVDLSTGLPAFAVVGMPETAVRESRDRVRSAILNSHLEFPDRRITVNLAPADLPKEGGRFDLPIALGILLASQQLPRSALDATEALGELALDGSLRPIHGGVAAALAAARDRHRVVLPPGTARRAAQLCEGSVYSAPDLLSLCALLRDPGAEPEAPPAVPRDHVSGTDLADIVGQAAAKRALEIAAAGGHNLLMVGPPGTGKSLLASALPGILPPPTAEEQRTALALHDLQGGELEEQRRPFRAPHHSASAAALVGGGAVPRPGEVSLAHGGVLFLDELPEFNRQALEMLREPLENGEIAIARARSRICYPARFQLLAAMNPCPCGFHGDPTCSCRCSPAQRERYSSRVSGPLLDRMDIQLRVERGDSRALLSPAAPAESSSVVRERVCVARARQMARQQCANSALKGAELLQQCSLDTAARGLLEAAATPLNLSARGLHRCLRVARTIADLRAKECVSESDVAEALGYRFTGASGTGADGAWQA